LSLVSENGSTLCFHEENRRAIASQGRVDKMKAENVLAFAFSSPAKLRPMIRWRQKREPVRVTREITVVNRHGFHARPAAEFVRKANSFRSEISLTRNGERFSATSLMDILRSNMECGATATLEAFGPDAEEAADALCQVLLDLREQELRE
jgi:phosphocarrier protein